MLKKKLQALQNDPAELAYHSVMHIRTRKKMPIDDDVGAINSLHKELLGEIQIKVQDPCPPGVLTTHQAVLQV